MKLKFKLAQVNLFVGDFEYNFNKIKNIINQAAGDGTDIVIFPELATTGYPPGDLLFNKSFINDNIRLLKNITSLCKGLLCIIGFVNREGDNLYNSAAVIYNRKIQYIYNKRNIQNYSVFDEKRYFKAGNKIPVIIAGGIRFGLGVCEDLWLSSPALFKPACYGKTDFIISINASPYYINKCRERVNILKIMSRKADNYIIYLNMIGAQDEIVFDGSSLVFNNKGELLLAGAQFKEDIIDFVLTFEKKDSHMTCSEFINKKDEIEYVNIQDFKPKKHSQKSPVSEKINFLSKEEEIYNALVLGTRDYILKNNFKEVIIGLSGGIDSAMTAAIAVDAIGHGNVETVFMPSRFSSDESYKDAKKLAENLKIKFNVFQIEDIFNIYLKTLKPAFKDLPFDIAEENIQARIRGNLLMAYSNKFGHLVLTTGNKSEMSTGYATLYGDLAGGFAVLKNVYKALVYKIAKKRNRRAGFDLIPKNIISKAPTAELKENQKDSDSLPEYEILDKILYLYIEKHLTFKELNKMKKFDRYTIKKVINLVNRSEYKRRQAPPGVKITKLSLEKDRKMPITSGYILK